MGVVSVSNHQIYDGLLNRLFRRRSKKTSKLRGTGLYVGNSPVAGYPQHSAPKLWEVLKNGLGVILIKRKTLSTDAHMRHMRHLEYYFNE